MPSQAGWRTTSALGQARLAAGRPARHRMRGQYARVVERENRRVYRASMRSAEGGMGGSQFADQSDTPSDFCGKDARWPLPREPACNFRRRAAKKQADSEQENACPFEVDVGCQRSLHPLSHLADLLGGFLALLVDFLRKP